MKRIQQFVWLLSTLILVAPSFVAANELPSLPLSDVFITEIQTGNATDGEEFIELYNNTDNDITFNDPTIPTVNRRIWKLQHSSIDKTLPDNVPKEPKWGNFVSIPLTGTIKARSYYLVSSLSNTGIAYNPGGVEPDQTYSPRLSNDGGGLQLVDIKSGVTTPHSRVGWFKSEDRTIKLAQYVVFAAGSRRSLQRYTDAEGNYLKDDGSLLDMDVSATVTPKAAWQPEIVEDIPLSQLQITELLPDPENGTQGEFVELFNPTTERVSLAGYTLRLGNDKYFIKEGEIEPKSFKVIHVGLNNNALLTNTGGTLQLFDPIDRLVTWVSYPKATTGEAWALIGDKWDWTNIPTPGEGNVPSLAIVAAATTKAATTKSPAKPKAVSKTAVAKPKKPTEKAAKTTKTTKPKKSNTEHNNDKDSAAANKATPLHPTMLAAVAGLALVYGAYEYRNDFRNLLYKLRRYRADRREAGQPV